MPERADVFQMRLGFRLDRFRHGVQNVGRFVNPAALNAGLAVNLMQRCPEPYSPVAHGQFRRHLQPPVLHVHEQLAPALGAFAKAVDQAQHILVAPFISPNNHQHTLAILVHPGREVDAVRPEPKDRAAKYT